MRAITEADYMAHFLSRVERLACEAGCWIWMGAETVKGYGSVRFHGSPFRAHRVSYELHFGSIPDGMRVCHTCDTPLCVRPDHLWLGSQLENVRDRESKGRTAVGEINGKSLLTVEDVREMRRLFSQGVGRARLAERFQRDYKTVHSVVMGLSWKHVA